MGPVIAEEAKSKRQAKQRRGVRFCYARFSRKLSEHQNQSSNDVEPSSQAEEGFSCAKKRRLIELNWWSKVSMASE